MRLGIFGGSFDPVHYGHLALADCCLGQARLDEVWFLPAALQPLKPTGPLAPEADRCRMIELAIAGREALRLCKLEIERGGTSYTVDTLRVLKDDHPDDQLFLLLGADALAEFPSWHDPHAILELATPLVVARQGAVEPDWDALADLLPDERRAKLSRSRIEMPAVPISSTEIRRRVLEGQAIDGLTPPEVVDYIRQRGLYGQPK